MLRRAIFATVLAMVSVSGAPAAPLAPVNAPATGFIGRIHELAAPPVVAAACCKICKKGKACGNSCISKSKSCRVGPGCACNG
ncbi:hypothetical protein [Pseudodonghicola flavimaris]|uniref:Uncharacterized protein n=1 Tax=Pseudodonghicola flavimaris TaxID=3050036 RepID=A0ABT7F7S0_9RHOB|nr:hypothetical protein [Pseudodonghicola flavimaris]MDK3020662.1 hypothetical protein [Pseudodonghicola flavimaris]